MAEKDYVIRRDKKKYPLFYPIIMKVINGKEEYYRSDNRWNQVSGNYVMNYRRIANPLGIPNKVLEYSHFLNAEDTKSAVVDTYKAVTEPEIPDYLDNDTGTFNEIDAPQERPDIKGFDPRRTNSILAASGGESAIEALKEPAQGDIYDKNNNLLCKR